MPSLCDSVTSFNVVTSDLHPRLWRLKLGPSIYSIFTQTISAIELALDFLSIFRVADAEFFGGGIAV